MSVLSCVQARIVLILAGVVLAFTQSVGGDPVGGLDPGKPLTHYSLDSWTADQGLPNETVNALAQTRDGYLWLGTYDGLARFDGLRFAIFDASNTPELGSNGIRALCEDRDGVLWIGTNGGGLTRYAEGRFVRFTTADGLPSDIVWALHADRRDGSLWIGTNGGGLARLRNGRFERFPVEESGRVVGAVAQDPAGNLWLASQREGLKRLSPDGRWTTFQAPPRLQGVITGTVAVDRDGTVWVGTAGEGLARLEGRHFVPLREAPPSLRSTSVSALRQDGEGTLWIGTNGGGLARYREGVFSSLTASEGLPENIVHSLLEDRDGSLWIGTAGRGVCRLREGSFSAFTSRDGLVRDFTYVTFEDSRGALWAGTAGGLHRLEGRRWVPVELGTGRSHAVRSIAEDPGGALWVGTYGGGVWRLWKGLWTRFGQDGGLVHDNVRAVLADRRGRVWVATLGGLSVFEEGAWRSYRTADGLPQDSLIALRDDGDGALWVGTDGGGLCRLRDGRFEVFTTRDGLASDAVLALYEDAGGVLWVGTNGGLSRFREGRFETVRAADGLASDAVAQIVEDGLGHLWLGTSRGVSRIRRASLLDAGRRGPLDVLNLGRADGLTSRQCTAPGQPAGMRSRDGRLWFSTTRGVAVVDPGRLRLEPRPPPVTVEEVTLDGRSHVPSGRVDVPAGTSRLQFRYTGVSLVAPTRVRFRFRMTGFDRGWIDAGDQRLAEYTEMPPGEYAFQVIAANGYGVWNEAGAVVSLRVRPHFYQTRWFVAGAVAALAGLAFLGHHVRVRSYEARERRLQGLVEERTRSLMEEKRRAERAGREAEEANAFKTELLAIAAHDLRSPLAVVAGHAELMRLGAVAPSAVPQNAEIIHRASERMLALIEALLTTGALERGTLELELAPVDLGRLAAQVIEDERARAERKGQRLGIEAAEGVTVHADEGRLRQVIENLVSNGIKFSPPGTSVTLRVDRQERTGRLEVRDEGPGITEVDKARLFQVFARLSARPTGGEGSTGLGLSIVKRLVDLHGGRVWAENAEDPPGGVRFIVELPLFPSSARPAPAGPD